MNRGNDGQSDKNSFSVGSLFAGIGGFCLAFKKQGFNVLWANENDPFAVQTYKHNFPAVVLYSQSITELSVVRDRIQPVDVLTAGFPCQPFSQAGYQHGFNDERGKLFFDIIRILREFGSERPKIVLLENVKNILYHNNGKTFSRIMEEIQSAGYWFMRNNLAVLNTKEHTYIPQNRERLYMAALSWDAFDYNDFHFPERVVVQREVKEFLDLDKQAEAEYYFDENSKYGKMFADSMSSGNPNSVYLLRRFYVRENKNDSVFTLTANMGEGGHNKPVIKDDWGIRNLTPIECLRLQGFPVDTFSFPPALSKSQQYRQIGNAVTVTLVEKLASECRRKLSAKRSE
jgi:DNA (cytosine-5)-methyltransferase 1